MITFSKDQYSDFFLHPISYEDDTLVVLENQPPSQLEQDLYRSVAKCGGRRYVVFGKDESGNLFARCETLPPLLAGHPAASQAEKMACYKKWKVKQILTKVHTSDHFRVTRHDLVGRPYIFVNPIIFKNVLPMPLEWEADFSLFKQSNEADRAPVEERLVNGLISKRSPKHAEAALPHNIWAIILPLLSVKDLNSCKRVCKSLREGAIRFSPISPSRYRPLLRLLSACDHGARASVLRWPEPVLKVLTEIPKRGWILHRLEQDCTLNAHEKRHRVQSGLPQEITQTRKFQFADHFWSLFKALRQSHRDSQVRQTIITELVSLIATRHTAGEPKHQYIDVLIFTIMRECSLEENTLFLEQALTRTYIHPELYFIHNNAISFTASPALIQERRVIVEALSRLQQNDFVSSRSARSTEFLYTLCDTLRQCYPDEPDMVNNAKLLLEKLYYFNDEPDCTT